MQPMTTPLDSSDYEGQERLLHWIHPTRTQSINEWSNSKIFKHLRFFCFPSKRNILWECLGFSMSCIRPIKILNSLAIPIFPFLEQYYFCRDSIIQLDAYVLLASPNLLVIMLLVVRTIKFVLNPQIVKNR